MPGHDIDSQFKFLIACIKNSSNGKAKVDFGAVAGELSIVSKGAAAKRFERLMKAHGISSTTMLQQRNNNGGSPSPGEAHVRERPSKKRKLSAGAKKPKIEVADDDEEDIKPTVKNEAIKNEDADDEDFLDIDGSFTKINSFPPASSLSLAEVGHRAGGRSDDEVYLISASDKMGSHAGSFGDGPRASSGFVTEKMQAPTNFHTDSGLLPQTPSNSFVEAGFDSKNWAINPELATFF